MQKITESYIADEFTGFDGDRIYEFENGQKWKQIRYRYLYIYKYRPRVRVLLGSRGYMLEVDGVDEMIEVRREA